MKLVRIIQDVAIPNMPAFAKGQQVRVSDEIGQILVDRGHAKLEKGKSESKIKSEKAKLSKSKLSEKKNSLGVRSGKVETSEKKEDSDVSVTKIKGKTK